MPRNGIITDISAFFSTTLALSLVGSTITIQAQLYSSSTPDNTFTALGSPVILAPALTGILAIGTVSFGTLSGFNIAVTQNNSFTISIYCDGKRIISCKYSSWLCKWRNCYIIN